MKHSSEQSTDGPIAWIIPCEVYLQLADKGSALALYVAITSYADKLTATCYPPQTKLAADLRCTDVTVGRNLKTLEDTGCVVVTRTKSVKDGKRKTRNQYFLPHLKTALVEMAKRRNKNEGNKNDGIINVGNNGNKNEGNYPTKMRDQLNHRTKPETKASFSIRDTIDPPPTRRGKR